MTKRPRDQAVCAFTTRHRPVRPECRGESGIEATITGDLLMVDTISGRHADIA